MKAFHSRAGSQGTTAIVAVPGDDPCKGLGREPLGGGESMHAYPVDNQCGSC
jgi:hypothetical protein